MIIAITSSSKTKSMKLVNALKKELSHGNTVIAGFRYPVHKIAKMFGWDNKMDERGKKLINTLYNAGIEYDRNIWIDKMEKLVRRVSKQKKTIIISDAETPHQIDMLRSVDNVRVIMCGEDVCRDTRLIDIYIDSEKPAEQTAREIIRMMKI